MATIGIIDIAMRATTTDFTKGMKTAADAVVGFRSTAVRDITGGLGTIGAGLGKVGSDLASFARESALVAAALKPVNTAAGLVSASLRPLGANAAKAVQSLSNLPAVKAIGNLGSGINSATNSLKRMGGSAAKAVQAFADLPGVKVFGNLASGLKTVTGGTGQLLRGVLKASAGTVLSVGSIAASFAKLGVSALGSLTSLATQLAKIGVVAGGVALVGLGNFALASLDAVASQAKVASNLGVSAGAFNAFSYAVKSTGGPVEALPEILGKLNGSLGLAARGSGPAAEGLRRLGLDAKTLADGDAITATKAIADELAKIQQPAERAAIATQIFGEQGAKMGRLWEVGSKGIKGFERDAYALGTALSDIDATKAVNAQAALDRVSTAITGIGTQLAVQLAPLLETAANKLVAMGTAGGGIGGKVSSALEWAGSAMSVVIDSTRYLQAGFYGISAVSAKTMAVVVQSLGWAAHKAEDFLNMLPGVKVAFTDSIDAIGLHLDALASQNAQAMQDAWSAPSAADGMKKMFEEAKAAADKTAAAINNTSSSIKKMGESTRNTAFEVTELAGKLKEQIATFGKSSAEVEIYKLQQAGASAADLARVKTLSDQLKGLEKNKEAMETLTGEAKKLKDETRTAMEKAAEDKAKIQKLFDKGLIDRDVMRRSLSKIDQETGPDVTQRAGAVEFGSKEARTALLNFRSGQNGDRLQTLTAQNTGDTVRLLRQISQDARAARQQSPVEDSI